MKQKQTDKIRALFVWVVLALVIISLIVWAKIDVSRGGIGKAIIPGFIAVLLIIFMIPFLKRIVDVKNGFPLKDERSEKIETLASARAYIISVYWMLALMFYTGTLVEDHGWPALIPRHVAAAGIIGMALAFALSHIWVNWRGEQI
ncbi:MAG: hypothetical protein ABH950_08100 [Candidatus Altiarchaeota archaeon]